MEGERVNQLVNCV